MKTSHNGPSRAVALAQAPDDATAHVIAKGYGSLAELIVRTAREHGLYVHESPELVGLLLQVDLDARIPAPLYAVIAELLVWLHDQENQLAEAAGAPPARDPAP